MKSAAQPLLPSTQPQLLPLFFALPLPTAAVQPAALRWRASIAPRQPAAEFPSAAAAGDQPPAAAAATSAATTTTTTTMAAKPNTKRHTQPMRRTRTTPPLRKRARARMPPSSSVAAAIPPRAARTVSDAPAPPTSSVRGLDAAIAAGALSQLPTLVARDVATLSAASILRSVTVLVEVSDWPAVISVFKTAFENPSLRFRFAPRLITQFFYALLKSNTTAAAQELSKYYGLLHGDEQTRELISPRAYNFAFVLFSRQGFVDDAHSMKKHVADAGFYLNRYSYNAFLTACAKTNRIDDAFHTLRDMAESNVPPDVVSFNVLISCCVRADETDMAVGLLSRMKDWGIQPDIYSYNSVINGLRKGALLELAFDLVAQMELSAGLDPVEGRRPSGHTVHVSNNNVEPVRPDLVTYNTLISALAEDEASSSLLRAREIQRHVERQGLRCNEVSFNALMSAAARADRVEEAFDIYDEMVARGLCPNCECFTTLISLCGRAGMLERAFEMHQAMVSANIPSSVVTFNALLTSCRSADRPDSADVALRVLEVMKTTPNCDPDVITYSTVIDALGRDGRFAEMKDLIGEMVSRGVEPNLVTYTTMIAALSRTGDLSGALRLVDSMEASGVSPNVYTFSSLISGAGRRGEFGRALEIMAMMRERGIKANKITYAVLTQLSVRTGRIEFVEQVVREMEDDERFNGTNVMPRVWNVVGNDDLFSPGKSRTYVQEIVEILDEVLNSSSK